VPGHLLCTPARLPGIRPGALLPPAPASPRWNCQTASSAAEQPSLPNLGLLPEEAAELSAGPGCRRPSLVLSPAAVSAARKCRFQFSAWQPPTRCLTPIIQQNSSHCELSAQRTSCKN